MTTSRLRSIRIFAFCLLVPFHSASSAERVEGEDIPPVENASFHQLVFADEDFVVLNNFYPPGGDSGFHSHSRDMFYVIIQAAEFSGQALGQPLTQRPEVLVGSAGFGSAGAKPVVHRVVNGDKGNFQIVVIELPRSGPLGNEIPLRSEAKQYTQILDNERLRAWRIIPEPGQSAAAISQVGIGMRVVVRGGLLATVTSGLPAQLLALRPGDFSVQPAGLARALTNSGTETIELVEIELK
jgi:hypothetical protein